jgi:hypothetical protein
VEVVSGVTFEGGVSSRYLRSQLESWAVDVSWIADFFDNPEEPEEPHGD